ncbi:MAG: DUF5615 family PIN-like protein [Thermodesulforhabdaceae bacterium]
MRFIANENIPVDVVNSLRKQGYDLVRVDEIRKGLSDLVVIKLAERENRKW